MKRVWTRAKSRYECAFVRSNRASRNLSTDRVPVQTRGALEAMLPAVVLAEHERVALAAVNRMKVLGVVRTTKADWRLVAAAQALRRSEFSDAFDAAAAMGKDIKQLRDVSRV